MKVVVGLSACIIVAAGLFGVMALLIRNGNQRHKARLRAQNYRPRDSKGHFVKRDSLG